MTITLNCAVLPIDLSGDVWTVEAPTLDCDKLSTCGITLLRVNIVDDRNSFGSVASIKTLHK